jgi:phospholipid/cholesterol/gamma-HCH transport system substrate-binding protein
MAVTRTQKINLGIFVTVAVSLLVGGIVLLVGLKLWESKDSYLVRFSAKNVSMSGLDVGSPVKYSGIQVGRVSSIKIDRTDVSVILVNLQVDGGTPVAEDTTATLGNIGITGLKYVELSRGSQTARRRKSGEEIPSAASFMDDITGKASTIAAQTEVILNRLAAFLSDERQQEFWATVTGVKELARTTESTIKGAQPQLVGLSTNLSALTGELKGITADARVILDQSSPEIIRVVKSTRELLEGIQTTRKKLDLLVDQANSVVGSVNTSLGEKGLQESVAQLNAFLERGNLLLKQSEEDITISLEHLRETSANLDEFSVSIKENPSLLLRSKDTQEREVK